jgi:hypothetical protein
MTKSTLIRAIVFALSFGGFATGAAAQGDLCDPEWWRDSATASGVRMLAQGQNVDAVCPNTADGDYPIHLAVFFADGPGAVDALLQSGASMARSNAIGQTPATLLDIRLNAAVTLRLPTDAILAIERLVNRGTEAQNLAQNNLCSLTWWPTASRVSVVNAIHQGADPNQDCDGFGNRPIHIAMDLNVTPYPVSSQIVAAIVNGLIGDGGVVPDARAVRIAENRYTRTKIAYEEAHWAVDEKRISGAEFARLIIWEDEARLYSFIRDYAGVESFDNSYTRVDDDMFAITDRVIMEFMRRYPARR